jgi:hypothetical protein
MTGLKIKQMRFREYSRDGNVIALQPPGGNDVNPGCASLPAEEGLRLMEAFMVLRTLEDRHAVIRLAEQLASKK